MKRKYNGLNVYRVYLTATAEGVESGYSYDTTQTSEENARQHVLDRLKQAGVNHLTITGISLIGPRRKYIGNILEYLIPIY